MITMFLLAGCAVWVPTYPGPLASLGRPPDHDFPAPAAAHAPTAHRPREDPLAAHVVDAASYYLTHDLGPGKPDDCSGFVCAVFEQAASVHLTLGVTNLWAQASRVGATHHRHRPALGDLAFFDDTWDSNGNGRIDDPLSHAAVVVAVDEAGTITFAQGGIGGKHRNTMVMNLDHPHDRSDADGTVINDNLRMPRASDPPGTRYFAAELWRGFATVTPEDIDRWNGSPSGS